MRKSEVAGEFGIDKRESGSCVFGFPRFIYLLTILVRCPIFTATHPPPSLGRINASRSAMLYIR